MAVISAASIYDELAENYDRMYSTRECRMENLAVWGMVTGGTPRPSLLDVGAGTGLALDLRMVERPGGRYRAVDPSRPMLDRLSAKHPWARDLHQCTLEDYLLTEAGTQRFHTVISLFGSPSYIHPDAIEALPSLGTRVFLMHYREGYHPPYEDQPPLADASREAAAGLSGAVVSHLNNFQIVEVGTWP